MDPIDSRNLDAEAINLHDSCATERGCNNLQSRYAKTAADAAPRIVRARQIATRAYCHLANGEIAECRADMREVMQLLDGELEGHQ